MELISGLKNIPVVFKKVGWGRTKLLRHAAVLAIAFCLLFGLHRFNYLLFHGVVEIFGVVIAGAIFMLAWNVRNFITISFFTILGVGYLAVSTLNFLHTFSYPGMNVFPNQQPDAAIQLWIAARFVESIAFFTAAAFGHRKINSKLLPLLSLGIAIAFFAAIMVWSVFPTCYVPGKGLTLFKIISEYVIIVIFIASYHTLRLNRQIFEKDICLLLSGAIWVTVLSELAFTLYTDVYGIFNVVGHLLKFISIYLIYLAIIESGLTRPYALVVHNLKQKEAAEKKINRTLRESETKFRLLAEKIEGVFWIATAPMEQVIYVSPGYEIITKRPCEDLYATPRALANIIHPDDRQNVFRAVKSATSDKGWKIEFRIVRPDGSVRWIHNQAFPVLEASGKMVQMCGMAYDITRQKESEERLIQTGQTLEQRVADRTNALSTAIGYLKKQVREKSRITAELKERNLMLKTLVQAIPDMVSYKDAQGRYLIANSAHKTFFGLKGIPVVGHTDHTLKTVQAVKEGAQREQLVLKTGKAIRFESVLRSASGFISHWDIRKVPVKGNSRDVVGILTLARDISLFKQREFELQQSKAMLQAFLNGISDPMLMVDNDLHVVYFNRAAAAAYPEQLHGKTASTCAQILCDAKGECDTCRVKVLMAQKKAASLELKRIDSDRIEKVYVYPLSEKENGLDGAVVRIADITEAKAMERHLIHSEKMNALGILVSGMVHEINNPNSFISFNLPILKAYLEKMFSLLDTHTTAVTHKEWFGMDYQTFRHEIFALTNNLAHGSSRIDNIISNLKTMTHPKQSTNQRRWVDLLDVMDKAVILCRREIKKRVKVFEVTPPPCNIQLKTDPEALEQVIINLLINASHAADKRESWVRIKAYSSEDFLNHAILDVSDNGCGMSQETMARIFDPFYTTKGPGVGTGLGLSVSYNLIRQLGGKILVESKLEEGTRFKVVLPIDAGAEDKPAFNSGKTMDIRSFN